MKKTVGQKVYERYCLEFGAKPNWSLVSVAKREMWERIGNAPLADDDPNEPPGAGN